MRNLSVAVVLSGCLWCLPAIAQEDDEELEELKPGAPAPVIASCLHKGDLYALARERDGHLFCYLQRTKLAAAGKEARIQKLPIANGEYSMVFHIHDDTSFSTDGIIYQHIGLDATRVSNLTDKHKREYWEHWTGMRLDPAFNLGIEHAGIGRMGLDFSATREATCSFTIDPDGKLFLFLAWKGRMRLWSGKLPRVEKAPRSSSTIRWDNWKERKETRPHPKPSRVVDTEIKNERFFAYQDKTYWLFVTESGQIHCLPREGKDKRTQCIWNDNKRPVRLLLEDNATGTTWAFAPRKDVSDKKLSDVFFPLAKKITPIAFDAKALPAWDLKKPMDMALAHARFLVKHKKVVLEEKKPALPEKK